MTVKPGYKTTEFWGKTAIEAAVLISALTSHLSPKWAAVAAAVVEGLYALGRSLVKHGVASCLKPVVPVSTTQTPAPVAAAPSQTAI